MSVLDINNDEHNYSLSLNLFDPGLKWITSVFT